MTHSTLWMAPSTAQSCDSHVTHLFPLQHKLNEELLQLLVAVVDAELLKTARGTEQTARPQRWLLHTYVRTYSGVALYTGTYVCTYVRTCEINAENVP